MHFTMPVPPMPNHEYHAHYQAFVRAMRSVEQTRQADRIRKAIEATSDSMECSPAFMSRVLVALGLQAPKSAFPDAFIEYVENRDRSIKYFSFERSDYLDDLTLLWEYDDVSRSTFESAPKGLAKVK